MVCGEGVGGEGEGGIYFVCWVAVYYQKRRYSGDIESSSPPFLPLEWMDGWGWMGYSMQGISSTVNPCYLSPSTLVRGATGTSNTSLFLPLLCSFKVVSWARPR
jgi:hypothetical protein